MHFESMLPIGPRNPPGGSGRGHDVGKCLLLNDRKHTYIQSVNAVFFASEHRLRRCFLCTRVPATYNEGKIQYTTQ